ncbi:MAG: glycoside hydrolase family 15 protein [Streptosporangiaceae bacterium]|nr:glycoside hydrolase family 15 protein [Streptosporangiaceae bacterium]
MSAEADRGAARGERPRRGPAVRDAGFVPIEDYGVIGDGQSAALVACDGSVDWWTAPAMDSPPLFAAVLDPAAGGRFTLEPAVPYQASRRYLPHTNVLETTFSTRDGAVRVIDSVNQGVNGLLAWPELSREIQPQHGEVPMRWRVAPGSRFDTARARARHGDVPLLHCGELMAALVVEHAGEPRPGPGEFSGEFVARPGTNALLALVLDDRGPVVVPSPGTVRRRRELTESAWRTWCDTIPYDGPDRELVERSALALKLLTYAPTGAMAAAATTSLPERIGGDRNYDYRYCWIRDTSFVLESFIQLGLMQEVQATLTWMLNAIAPTAPEIHPFYTLHGSAAEDGDELSLRGYRDSAPVRHGNSAVDQPQWGNYGDLLECVWLAVDRSGTQLDADSGQLLSGLADRVCEIWTEPDCGIWELETRRHNTFSKVGCWVTLDRILRLADRGQVPARGRDRWQRERAAIRDWIDRKCWSQAKRAYTAWAGSDEPDAALLLLARTGFIEGRDPRFGRTVDAIRSELAEGPLLYRDTMLRKQEGAFVACSFWLVDALVRNGRPAEATEVWRGITAHASELGLFSEEIDPATGAFLGNVPQGLSHLSLISAACQLHDFGAS